MANTSEGIMFVFILKRFEMVFVELIFAFKMFFCQLTNNDTAYVIVEFNVVKSNHNIVLHLNRFDFYQTSRFFTFAKINSLRVIL